MATISFDLVSPENLVIWNDEKMVIWVSYLDI